MYWLEYYEPLIRSDYNAAYGSGFGVARGFRDAADAAGQESFSGIATGLDTAKLAMYDFVDECLTRRGHQNYYLRDWLIKCNQYIDAIGEPEPFTMDSLITAMLSASPDQIMYFVGLVDAYRQSIWTKPFNHEFYAALARGFMEWE